MSADIPKFAPKAKKGIDNALLICYNNNVNGALAQLGAHNTGSVGVRGSNPLCSTNNKRDAEWRPFYYFPVFSTKVR